MLRIRTLAGLVVLGALLVLPACGDNDRFIPADDFVPRPTPTTAPTSPAPLRIGVAAVPITPCGVNPFWDGPITGNGVWGEEFTDRNGNGVWDSGEPFVDDLRSNQLDTGPNGPRNRYNGIFLAGFGSNRLATGCNDDIWARTIIIDDGSHKVAMVSVDLVGYLSYGTYYGFQRAEALVPSSLGIDTFIYSSTHQHQGPDSMGLWGFQQFADGKWPRYLEFVDRMIARSIELAAEPANMREAHAAYAATTDPVRSPSLQGLQVRTGCRPPWFFDEELRALRFVDGEGETIATVVNWSTHPESLEDRNTLVSSDFVHYIRERVEAELGGMAVYFSGALGAAEIVGDTCVGGADPRHDDGTNEFDRRDDIGVPRTQALGEIVGDAVVEMLEASPPLPLAGMRLDEVRYFGAGTNELFSFAMTAGILDLDPVAFASSNCGAGTLGLCAPISQYLLAFHDEAGAPLLQMATAPGELFPELFYGMADHARTDCPEAHTGLPYEPSIRDAMAAPHRWLIGLAPDHYGYIVPGYDFRAPPSLGSEQRDPCQGLEYFPGVPRRRVPAHYHESLAVGPDIAATTTCYAVRLLGREDVVGANDACRRAVP